MDERWQWAIMDQEDFLAMISSDGFLNDPLVKTRKCSLGFLVQDLHESCCNSQS